MGAARIKVDDAVKAIEGADGILSHAATVLGCARSTLYAMRDKHPAVAQAIEEARASTVDELESLLMQRARGGDTTAIIFGLKTLGKARGYVERTETVGDTTMRVVIEDATDDD